MTGPRCPDCGRNVDAEKCSCGWVMTTDEREQNLARIRALRASLKTVRDEPPPDVP